MFNCFASSDFVVMVIDNVQMVVMNKTVKIIHVLIINLPVLMVDVYHGQRNVMEVSWICLIECFLRNQLE